MKKTVLTFTAASIIFSMLFSSCATMFGKSSYPISVNSNPNGATVTITDKKNKEVFKGQSPATVRLKSGAGYFSRAEYQVKISSQGYDEQIIPVNFKLNGWYFGNLLLGGVIGMLIVDPATGAMWKLDTDPINVTLNSATATATVPNETPTLQIVDIDNITDDLKEHLVRIN